MNRNQAEGKWNEFNAKVKQMWGDLTDDEITKAEGNVDELAAQIQQRYGDSQENVARQLNQFKEESNS